MTLYPVMHPLHSDSGFGLLSTFRLGALYILTSIVPYAVQHSPACLHFEVEKLGSELRFVCRGAPGSTLLFHLSLLLDLGLLFTRTLCHIGIQGMDVGRILNTQNMFLE